MGSCSLGDTTSIDVIVYERKRSFFFCWICGRHLVAITKAYCDGQSAFHSEPSYSFGIYDYMLLSIQAQGTVSR